MRSFLTLLGIILISASAHSAIWYVPDDYPTIQDAIDYASNGDTIIVRAGTYVEKINFLGKAITLKSEQGPEATVLDGNHFGSVVKFQNGEGASALGITGQERFDIGGLAGDLKPRQDVSVTATRPDGSTFEFSAVARLDSNVDILYYQNGGILHTVLRNLLTS